MNSKNLPRNMKVTIYKTSIRPVLVYGAEARVLTKQDEMQFGCFESKKKYCVRCMDPSILEETYIIGQQLLCPI
jgi:hypothetical protein